MKPLRCPRCGTAIGAYEPLVVLLSDGTNRHGSLLTLSTELSTPGHLALHEECHVRSAGANAGTSGRPRAGWEPCPVI
jgi:hypothetical protein